MPAILDDKYIWPSVTVPHKPQWDRLLTEGSGNQSIYIDPLLLRLSSV